MLRVLVQMPEKWFRLTFCAMGLKKADVERAPLHDRSARAGIRTRVFARALARFFGTVIDGSRVILTSSTSTPSRARTVAGLRAILKRCRPAFASQTPLLAYLNVYREAGAAVLVS